MDNSKKHGKSGMGSSRGNLDVIDKTMFAIGQLVYRIGLSVADSQKIVFYLKDIPVILGYTGDFFVGIRH